MKALLFVYSVGLRLVLAVVGPVVRILSPNGKLTEMFRARRAVLGRIDAFRSTVPGELWWFHVASAGELEQAIPLMEAVRVREPECVIFASFFSPSAERGARNEAERRQSRGLPAPWDYADYLCWDLPGTVAKYVRILQPKAFVTLHSELWPALFHHLQAVKVPISIGAVFFPRADKLSKFRKAYYRRFLAPVSRLATVDAPTTRFLQAEFPQKDIQILGDPRIDRVLERASRNAFIRRPSDMCELVFASISEDDWAKADTWLAGFAQRRHATRLWVVPHELDAALLSSIEGKLRNHGIPFSRVSSSASNIEQAQVVVVDQVGHLAELYARVRIAFVGGSFSGSVHNVLEPAAYGVAVVTGPNIENSCEAVEMLAAGALVVTDSAELLAETLDALLNNERYRDELGERSKRYLLDRKGVRERYGAWLGSPAATGTSIRSTETSYSSSIPETL